MTYRRMRRTPWFPLFAGVMGRLAVEDARVPRLPDVVLGVRPAVPPPDDGGDRPAPELPPPCRERDVVDPCEVPRRYPRAPVHVLVPVRPDDFAPAVRQVQPRLSPYGMLPSAHVVDLPSGGLCRISHHTRFLRHRGPFSPRRRSLGLRLSSKPIRGLSAAIPWGWCGLPFFIFDPHVLPLFFADPLDITPSSSNRTDTLW